MGRKREVETDKKLKKKAGGRAGKRQQDPQSLKTIQFKKRKN